MDGHYRKIEVKMADSKLKLSYRHGYNADEDAVLAQNPKKDADPLRRQLVHGMPDATQILFAARVVPLDAAAGDRAARSRARTPAFPGLRPATRSTSSSGGTMSRWRRRPMARTRASFEVGLIAWDMKGKSVNWEEGTQRMALKPDLYASIQKSGIPAHMEIDLPNTDLYLKLGVVDGRSGKAGTLEIPLHVAAANTTAQAAQGQLQKANEP